MSKHLSVAAIPAPRVSPDDQTPNPLPFWQTEPCPSWCDLATGSNGHHNADLYDDRHHFHSSADVFLTLHDGSPYGDDRGAEQLRLNVSAEQHYRASTPDVVLCVPVLDKHRDYTEHDVRMTVDETRELAKALLGVLAELGVEVDGSTKAAA